MILKMRKFVLQKIKNPEELRLSEVNQTANCLCVLVEKPTQEAETGPKSLYFNYG